MKKWTLTVDIDSKTNELIIPIPDDCIDQIGWEIGDVLVWEKLNNGSWSIRKKEQQKEEDNDK